MTGPMPPELDPEVLAKARLKVAEARKKGFKDDEIDAYLQSEIGAKLADVEKPNARDFWRTTASAVTLGHGDELAGLATKLMGGDYTHARDAAREESAGFSAANPKLNMATEMVGGGLPAALTAAIPGLGPSKSAGWIRNAMKAMGMAAPVGVVAGEGHSEAPTVGGVAKDAAVGGAASAAMGGLLSTGGSAVQGVTRSVLDALHPERAIVREAATQLPTKAAAVVARQEAIAPGTAVAADLSPEMQALTRGVGADAKAGVTARLAAEGRVKALQSSLDELSTKYEAMNRPLPVNDELKAILKEAGRSNILKKDASDVDFNAVQRVRTALKAEAAATRNSAVRHDKRAAADKLTAWLDAHVPELESLDSDWAFMTKRIGAARKTLQEITNSSKNYAASRAYGADEGSVGGSLSVSSKGSVVGRMFEKILAPDRAGRARAANDLLLTPGDATNAALSRITKARAAMDAPPHTMAMLARLGLLGDVIPQAAINSGLLSNR